DYWLSWFLFRTVTCNSPNIGTCPDAKNVRAAPMSEVFGGSWLVCAMRRQRLGVLTFVGLLVFGATFGESLFSTTHVNEGTRVRLMDRRTSELDLEITGELAGIPPTVVRYVSREELRKLPQVDYGVSDDANFGKAVRIQGVLLEDLSKVL